MQYRDPLSINLDATLDLVAFTRVCTEPAILHDYILDNHDWWVARRAIREIDAEQDSLAHKLARMRRRTPEEEAAYDREYYGWRGMGQLRSRIVRAFEIEGLNAYAFYLDKRAYRLRLEDMEEQLADI